MSITRSLCIGRYAHDHGHDPAETWHVLGVALLRLGHRAAASIAFRNALSLDGRRVRSRLALGNLLFDAGQCEQALRCFQMADATLGNGCFEALN